jgi:hypothetical protein
MLLRALLVMMILLTQTSFPLRTVVEEGFVHRLTRDRRLADATKFVAVNAMLERRRAAKVFLTAKPANVRFHWVILRETKPFSLLRCLFLCGMRLALRDLVRLLIAAVDAMLERGGAAEVQLPLNVAFIGCRFILRYAVLRETQPFGR